MKLNRALAFLISMTMLIGVLPVSAMAADYAGDGITMDMEVGDPCANGHDYESVITREPTCKKTGIETFTCTVCGDSYDEEIPKTDHMYDDGTATEPTCTKAGKVTYTCTVCGHTPTEEGEPALGHSYTVEETKATCEKAGEIVYTCTRCGDKYKEEGEEALGHEYEKKVTKPATETSEGEVTYTCKRCKDSYKEAIPKLESKSGKKDDSKKEDSKKEDKEKDDSKKTDEKDDAKTSSCKVTLPSGKGYAIMAMGETTVDEGDSFSFTLNIAEGYKKGKDFSVKAGSNTLKEGSDGTYTIKNIKKDVKVKVSGVEKAGDMDEDLIIPDSKEEAGFAGAANGAEFATDEPAVPAEDIEVLTDDPLNSAESEYKLYVYGIPVTADNKGDILGEYDDEDGDAKKTAVYDDEENKLTLDALDDATITFEQAGPAVKYEGTEKLTIIFKGNCFLVGNEEENAESGSEGYGIYAPNGSLHIEAGGEGVMEISNKEAIKGKDVSFDKELCLGPKGVPQEKDGVDGLTGDDMGVSIASSCQWSATDYEWKDGYSTCMATKTCSNNSDHKDTENGTVTSHYEEPTKDEPGKTVYTATFKDKVFEDQTAEVENPSEPALGYDLYVWGDPVTAENQGDVLGDKTVTYDPVQNILKLNGATITAPGDGPAIRYNGTKTLTIEFTGNNSLTGTAKEGVGDGKTAYGIIADNGPLVIKAGGKGELRITNEEAISGMSISVDESLCIGPKGIFVIPGGTGYSGDSGMVISSSHDWSEWKKSETLNDTEERTCSKCGKTQTRDLQHEHTLEEIKEKPATCTEDGHIAYYQCSVCKLLFSDKEAKTEITTADLVPAEYKATGHDWNEPTYTWADDYSKVTATRVCKNNNEHVETETVATTKDVKKETTCEAAGDIIYTTAAFENTAFTQQTKEVKPAALGHLWGAPVFKWADSYTKATATFTCRRDSSHAKTVKAAVKGMITMPTTSTNGKITYTASVKVNGKAVTDTKEAVIKPAGTAGYKYTANAYSWNNTSSSGLNLTVKRSEYDAITFRAFTGVLIDGKTVSSSNYATAKGSLKLTLNKDYLKNLAVGAHTIKTQFKDGTAETKFTVRGTTSKNGSSSSSKSSSSSPKTGDDTNAGLWIGILIVAILGIAGILIYRKRKNK